MNTEQLGYHRLLEEKPASVRSNILGQNSSANEITTVAMPLIATLSDISIPEVKWRKLSTANLIRQKGFFKPFKYLWQILKRFSNDIYLGLRNAITAYNNNKTEENLDKIIHHIRLLKRELIDCDVRDILVCIANEAIIYKAQFLLERSQFAYDPQYAEKLIHLPLSATPSEALIQLDQSMTTHNKEKTSDNGLQVILLLFDWIIKHPKEYRANYPQTQCLIRQLSFGLQDKELFLLFNLLQSEKTERALLKMFWLRRQIISLNPKHFHCFTLEFPQINQKYFPSDKLLKLRDCIKRFNHHKTDSNFVETSDALIRWQFHQYHDFNHSNGMKIVKVMEKILLGKTMQDDIWESDDYPFLVRLEQFTKELSSCSWKSLPIPIQNTNISYSLEMDSLINQIDHFNSQPKDERGLLINPIIKRLFNWIETEPNEYMKCNGHLLLKALKIEALFNLFVKDFDLDQWLPSNELHALHLKIKQHNFKKCEDSFKEVTEQLYRWEQYEPEEFKFFQGSLFKDQLKIENNLKSFAYAPVLLPNSHPNHIIERNLEDDPLKALNGYILSFHNTVAPWSHTELVFVKKEHSVITSVSENEVKLKADVSIQYVGIGADDVAFDDDSHHAEGVHIIGDRLLARMEELVNRRKNEIQKNMNVPAGAKAGLLSFKGEIQKELLTKNDKIRHFRTALIDNFLTNIQPNAFLPDLKETRYHLDLYESGGDVYHKWTEDENGQFAQVKAPSSQERSGEFIEGEYRKNSYVLHENGRLKSAKSIDKPKLLTHEIGNVIYRANGSLEWIEDSDLGQYFKPKGEPVEKAERDLRPLYSSESMEKYLSGGESEWCGSYALRMVQSAYAYVYMPQFVWALEKLEKAFYKSTEFEIDESPFQKRHAKTLFILADQFASKMVESQAGRKYFRDMNRDIKINPRITPDMLLKALMGKAPGIINNIKRSWKTILLPKPRTFPKGFKMNLLFASGALLVGVFAVPTAALKLAHNMASATAGLLPDMVLASKIAYDNQQGELERKEESEIRIENPKLKLAGAAFYGCVIDGIGKRILGDYVGLRDIKDAVLRKAAVNPSPFAL